MPADSGVTKRVCPDSYTLNIVNGTTVQRKHSWRKGSPTQSFFLNRSYASMGGFPLQINNIVLNDVGTVQDLHNQSSFAFSTIGVLTSNSALPTANDYLIPDRFFGSYTSGGKTYAWARGACW